MKAPAFQWYVNDFLGSGKVASMSLEEVGGYTILLNYDWNEGGLPDELAPFPRWLKVGLGRAQRVWDAVRPNFVLRDGRWYNPRLEKERAKQKAWREKSARGGHASVEAKRNHPSTTLQPPLEPSLNTPSPSSTPVTTTAGYPPDFDLLWKAYPKRHGGSNKAGSYRCYLGHLKAGVAYDVMLEGVKRYALKCIADGSVGTRFVKDCKTFLGPDKYFLDDHEVGPAGTDGVLPISRTQDLKRRGYDVA